MEVKMNNSSRLWNAEKMEYLAELNHKYNLYNHEYMGIEPNANQEKGESRQYLSRNLRDSHSQ